MFDSITPGGSVSARFREALATLQSTKANHLAIENATAKARRWQTGCLAAMLAIITFVSCYDVYWSFKTAEILYQTEQNPIGMWLISLDGGDVSLFMTVKMVGTMLVILSIPALYCYRRKWGLTCAAGLTVFQCLLMVYFEIGHIVFG